MNDKAPPGPHADRGRGLAGAQTLADGDPDIAGLSITMDNLVDAAVVTTAEAQSRIVLGNAAFAALVGYPVPGLPGRTLDFLQQPEDFAETLSRLHGEVVDYGSFFMEAVLHRRDGRRVVVEWQGTPIADRDGGIRTYLSIVRDVSHQRRDTVSLADERERARVVLGAIDDAVLSVDATGRVDDMNAAAEAMTGWTLDEARHRAVADIVRVTDAAGRDLAGDPAASCLATGEPVAQPGRLLLMADSGSQTAVEAFATPLRAADGECRGAVLVLRERQSDRSSRHHSRLDPSRDGLTGLIDRAEFERRLDAAIASARQYRRSHVLCYMDLDHFRQINESFGRDTGDAVLRQVAGLLRARFRERDTIARLGGDEFGLLLDNCTLDEAERLVLGTVQAFEAARFSTLDAPAVRVVPSVGLVDVTAQAKDAAQLVASGDIACYTAKQLGRGRSHIYRSDRLPAADADPVVLYPQAFRAALDEDRFELFYQPIVPLLNDSDLPVHYEFLLRLRGNSGKLMLPRMLIAAAERHGLMAAVDRWVIRTALGHLARPGSPFARGVVAINLSGNSLDDPGLVDFITAQFASCPIAPRSVCFEITETEAIRDLGHAVGVVGGLRKLGCSIALDDFGSGQSSFAYLKALPADYLKIDGSFVRGIIDSAVDRAVVSAINETGRIMGMKTIAEFAHSGETVECLRRLGVDYAQGDAISPPRAVTARKQSDLPPTEADGLATGTRKTRAASGQP